MPYPLPLTRTEAYLAYKAGVIQQSDLKPSLAVPRIGIDDWLAYWTGLKNDYPKNPDGTPKMLQEEEKYIAYLCGVTDTYPEKCLRRVGAYLRYLISARWGRPDHPLNREELYLSLLKTQVIPSGDPSSDIVIDGTAKAPFVDVKMYGDTFQQTYTGKNLFNFVSRGTTQGLTATYDTTTGIIAVTGTADSNYSNISTNIDLTLEAGQTFTSSIDRELPVRAVTRVTYTDNTQSSFTIEPGQTSVTWSSVKQVKQIRLYISLTVPGTSYNLSFKFQIEVGSTATSFEPYVGGQASPNPDYPQPIQTVTGEQTVTINGTDYPIDLGTIELCKLGTYQDYIYKSGGKWYVHKATGKQVLASSDITLVDSYSNVSYAAFPKTMDNIQNGNYDHGDIVNFFSAARNMGGMPSGGWNSYNTDGEVYNNATRAAWWCSFTKATTLATMRSKLTGMAIVYALATATDTTITDQTLIAQLEALVAGGAENGTTYIKVNATEPNLPGLLYVEAAKYVE